ncbi:MAG: hypothetical protein WCI04_04170 [archaeon]
MAVLNFVIPVGNACYNCIEGASCPPCQNLYLHSSNPSLPVLVMIGVIDLIVSFVLSIIIVFIIRKFSKKNN